MNVLQTIFASGVVERIGWTLLHSLWQGAGAAILAGAALTSPRRSRPEMRYLAAWTALLGLAAAMVVTFMLVPATAARSLTESGTAAAVGKPASPRILVEPVEDTGGFTTTILPPEDTAPPVLQRSWWRRLIDRLTPSLRWLVAAWGAGVVCLSLRNLGGWWSVHRLQSAAGGPVPHAIEAAAAALARRLKLARPVRVLRSALVETPLVIGALKPVILLPVSILTDLPMAQIESILAHELAHVARHDYLVNLFQSVIETVLFYHPSVWWLSRRMRLEREHCCDDVAVALTHDRQTYVSALAAVAAVRVPNLAPAAAGRSGGGRVLLPRLRRVLGMPDPDAARSSRWLAGLAAMAILAAAVGMTLSSRLSAQTASPDQPANAEPRHPAATQPGAMDQPAEYPSAGIEQQRRLLPRDQTDVDRKIAAKLKEPIPINFENMKLDRVIDYFRQITEINIFVNWPGLEATGVTKDSPISLTFSAMVPADEALKLVLQKASAPNPADPAAYAIRDGLLIISTASDIKAAMQFTRIYDVRDLLFAVQNQLAPNADATEKADFAKRPKPPTHEEMLAQVVNLIKSSVGKKEDWNPASPGSYTMTEMNGNLIIHAGPNEHRQISDLLRQLQANRTMQVSYTAALFFVSDKTCDKLFENPVNATSNFTLFARIDEAQKAAMYKTVHADPDNVVLTLPRMTLMNGQAGFISLPDMTEPKTALENIASRVVLALQADIFTARKTVYIKAHATVDALNSPAKADGKMSIELSDNESLRIDLGAIPFGEPADPKAKPTARAPGRHVLLLVTPTILTPQVENQEAGVPPDTTSPATTRPSDPKVKQHVDDLIKEANALRHQQKYEEALQRINEALALDPQNVTAQAMQDMLEDTIVIERSDHGGTNPRRYFAPATNP